MRVDPLAPRSPIAIVAKTARVVRSSGASIEDDEKREPDLTERRARKAPPRFMVTADPASHASSAVLSALIDLQIGR